ncbi:MAG: RHS repeat-associated core domain-containing protein [Akkermansia sp.]|nr:RHS repeat-associated core domain-containing protein [Akkermansia sp.]
MAVINTTYDANEVNQYSSIRKNEESAFVPTFDAAGNQTLVRTATGTWSVTYNAENRPVIFQKTTDSVTTRITCTYDYMGRRATKKVEEITTDAEGNETTIVISNHRFIYRGYLQIGCCDLTRSGHPCLWLITWDPTQPVATRPLAIQKDGTWYTYGRDLTKNICEIFGQNGYIRSTYAYTPFGAVTTSGDITQPIQWSSEYYDSELALVYYNYRHYNPTDGRWINCDPIAEQGGWNLYGFVGNAILYKNDFKGRVFLKHNPEEYRIPQYININELKNTWEAGRTEANWEKISIRYEKYFIINRKISLEGDISIRIFIPHIYKKDKMIYNHEFEHVKINVKYWNKFADNVNFIEKVWCSECGLLAYTYATTSMNFRMYQARVKNALFDIEDYTRQNRERKHINRVIYEYNKYLEKAKKLLVEYNESGEKFYNKCVPNKRFVKVINNNQKNEI